MQDALIHILVATVVVIICLSFVIGIHEAGHALIARYFHIPIQRISIGFGKTLFRWHTRSGCQIDFNILLVGGRVHLLNSRVTSVADHQLSACLDQKPIWVRTLVLFSGSLANFLVAIIALWCMMMMGFKQYVPVIEHVTPMSHAAIAGLKPNDRIVKISGQNTFFWRDVMMQFIIHTGEKVTPIVVCTPEQVCRSTTLNLNLWTQKNRYGSFFEAIGITPKITAAEILHMKGLSFMQALYSAWSQCWQIMWFFCIMIKKILTAHIPFAALLGPFRLFQTIIDTFFQGFAIFLYFLANFNIAMALVNLLPLPSLDGGSIIYCWFEKIRGKPISVALELLLYRLFLIVLVLVFIQLILNDLHSYYTF